MIARYDWQLLAGSCLSLTTTTRRKRTVLQRFSRPPCRSLGASTKSGAIYSGFAIGTCWLACSFDARIERSRLVRQIPLPLSAPGSIRDRRQQSSLRPAMALGGFLLVLFSGMSAVIIGTPVYLQSPEVAELQQEHPGTNSAEPSWEWDPSSASSWV